MRVIPLSAKKVIKILENIGYSMSNSSGSHRVFSCRNNHVTVPDHKEIQTGTLRSIIRQTGLSTEEFYSYINL
jgi:predicted RNA binding protein YcfA (HicA-like mRNA interferase family)